MAASGTSDALTLRMLGQILAPSKCTLVNIKGAGSPMQLADRVAEESPAMVILSHLPPEALAQARYQVRRLRARFAGLAILVGRWGEAGSDAASEGLSGVGATHVAFTLADARDQILAKAASAVPVMAATAMTADAEDRDPSEHLARAGQRADGTFSRACYRPVAFPDRCDRQALGPIVARMGRGEWVNADAAHRVQSR